MSMSNRVHTSKQNKLIGTHAPVLFKIRRRIVFFFLLNTPCTYPRRSYLESLHSDAHRVPYLCPGRGHEEFRALWSSWNETEEKKTKRQRSSYWAWRANLVGYLFCHRGRETNTISCQLRSRAERQGTCRFFHPKDCAGFIPPWREKELNWVDTHY